jgi:hypothetical protein
MGSSSRVGKERPRSRSIGLRTLAGGAVALLGIVAAIAAPMLLTLDDAHPVAPFVQIHAPHRSLPSHPVRPERHSRSPRQAPDRRTARTTSPVLVDAREEGHYTDFGTTVPATEPPPSPAPEPQSSIGSAAAAQAAPTATDPGVEFGL